MGIGQRYMGSSINGMSRGLFVGTETVGNFINGNFEKEIWKVKGAIPDYDVNRAMPLRIWEIVEIHWKDFAQYVGPLQGFGWEFKPGLYDQMNADKQELEDLKIKITADEALQLTEATKLNDLQREKKENEDVLKEFVGARSATLTVEDVHPSNLKGAPQESKFVNDQPFSASVAYLTSRVNAADDRVAKQQSIVDDLNALIVKEKNDLTTKQADYDKNYANIPVDQLGLTDAFMHAVYTQFLKHFWAHNIGQTNPELWVNYVNSFMGNYLPMLYKGAMVIANSKDFSTAQWQEGGATSSSTSSNTTAANTASMGDAVSNGQTGSVGAVQNTPQGRMQLNARNTEFANQLQNNEATSQDGTSNTNFMDQNSKSTGVNALNSVNNGKQWQLDPLKVWNQVLMDEGYFFDLWDKAMAYGLFDGTM